MKNIKKTILATLCPILMSPSLVLISSCNKGAGNNFLTDSWSNVLTHANQGLNNLKNYYGRSSFVGLTRQITINNCIYSVQVVGENEDYLAINTGAPNFDKPVALTFMFKTVVQEYQLQAGAVPYEIKYRESTNYDEDMWGSSIVREYLTGDFFEDLNDALKEDTEQEGIKTVSKSTIFVHGNGDVKWNQETVFLPSLADIFSSKEDNYQLPEVVKGIEHQDAYKREGIPTPTGLYKRYTFFDSIVDTSYDQPHPELQVEDGEGHTVPYWLRSCKPTPVYDDWSEWGWDSISKTFQPVANVHDISVKACLAPIFCI